MGYYSEVAFEIREEDFKRMMKELRTPGLLKKYGFNGPDELINFLNMGKAYKCEMNNSVVVHFPDIKWYYEPAKAIQEFVQSLDEYAFVRIGEDYEDTEVYYNTSNIILDALDVVRKINFSYEMGEEMSL